MCLVLQSICKTEVGIFLDQGACVEVSLPLCSLLGKNSAEKALLDESRKYGFDPTKEMHKKPWPLTKENIFLIL
jgi:hypothetical protein